MVPDPAAIGKSGAASPDWPRADRSPAIAYVPLTGAI